MEPLTGVDLNGDVRALMSADDEVNWLQDSLFKKADSLGESHGELLHTSRKLHLASDIYDHLRNSPPDVTLKHLTAPGLIPFLGSSAEAGFKLPQCEPKHVSATKQGLKGGVPSVIFRNSFKPSTHTGVRRKVWKLNKRNRRMVLGTDVGLDETCRLSLCGLVGRLSYSYLVDSPMSDWIKNNWVPFLGYAPELLCLTKGWMGFICKTSKDANILLKTFWVIGGSNLLLKRWRVAFEPADETLSVPTLMGPLVRLSATLYLYFPP
jgi:hypothetical protein